MLLVEQRASTMLRQRTVFGAVFHVMLAMFTSSSVDLLQVAKGGNTFLLPGGFHSKACLIQWLVSAAYGRSKTISVLLSLLVCALVLFCFFFLPINLQDLSLFFNKASRLFDRACVTFQISDP